MPDGLNTYKSTLTPQEVDEAFRNIGKVQANIEKAAGYAQTAEQYGTIVQQNQAAIQAIEDNLADVQGAAQNAADAKNAATSAAASASAASQSASDAEDAAKRAEAAAGVNPSDYYTKQQADAAFATAAQGQLAQSAVQSVNGKTGGEIELSPADIGAATAAQGQLAQTSMQSVWVAGVGQVQNKVSQNVDLLQVNTTDANGPENAPYFFGSNSPSSDLINSPYTSSPFYGYRQTLVSKYYGTNTSHLTTVIIFESYPVPGRIWGNTYDDYAKNWIGWKQNGVQAAAFAYDEMAAAYNEGVASVGQ